MLTTCQKQGKQLNKKICAQRTHNLVGKQCDKSYNVRIHKWHKKRITDSHPNFWQGLKNDIHFNLISFNVKLLLKAWKNLNFGIILLFKLYFFMAWSRSKDNTIIKIVRLYKQYKPEGIFFGIKRSLIPSLPVGAPSSAERRCSGRHTPGRKGPLGTLEMVDNNSWALLSKSQVLDFTIPNTNIYTAVIMEKS